jgi:hypothetical protein
LARLADPFYELLANSLTRPDAGPRIIGTGGCPLEFPADDEGARGAAMQDLIYLGLTAVFFVLAAAYIVGCERLK